MKECDYEDGQEKCPRFLPKSKKNWQCLYYRPPGSLLDRGVCNGEYPPLSGDVSVGCRRNFGKDD